MLTKYKMIAKNTGQYYLIEIKIIDFTGIVTQKNYSTDVNMLHGRYWRAGRWSAVPMYRLSLTQSILSIV